MMRNEGSLTKECAVVIAATLIIALSIALVSTGSAEVIRQNCPVYSQDGYCPECDYCIVEDAQCQCTILLVSGNDQDTNLFSSDLLFDPLTAFTKSLAYEFEEPSCGCDQSDEKIGMRNPAAVYCRELGYEYRIEKTAGGERGVCVMPNGVDFDEWEFYEGEAGQEFSYCAQRGWATASKGSADGIALNCTTCILPDGSQKSVSELLNLTEKCQVGVMNTTESRAMDTTFVENGGPVTGTLGQPSSFDWRNYDEENWMTLVKNQGGCGSCWAFSAVGIVEPIYNIYYNNPNWDLDLSEQYLVADCLSDNTCCGGWHSAALNFIQDSGIPDEACLSYVDGGGCSCYGGTCDSNCNYRDDWNDICSDKTCSDRCTDWSDRLTYIDEWGGVLNDNTAIKNNLIEKGPLSVAMRIGSSGDYWDNGVYRCTYDYNPNHAVVIAGYNDTGGYWIVKNSWGSTWNGNGYFNVGYGECWIENAVYYAALAGDTVPPTVEILSPVNDTWFDSEPVNVTFYPWDNIAEVLNYTLFVDDLEVTNGTATRGQNRTVELGMLPECNHTVRVNVTDDMGLEGSDEVIIHVDLTPPTIAILSPANDTWFDSEPFNLSFYSVDNKADVLTYSIFDGAVEIANGTTANGSITNVTIDPAVLGDCDHVLRVNVSDTVGKTNTSSVTVHIDLTPPLVAILAPANDSCFESEPVNITFHLCDNKADVLNYSIFDGETEIANGSAANCSNETANLGTLPECDHVIRVNVTDYVGKTNFSEVTIHIDLTPPTVEILSPANGSWLGSEPVNVTFHPWDNKADLLEYQIYVDGEEKANGTAANCSDKIANVGVLPECDHVIRVNVTDCVGKTNFSEVTVHVDRTPPSVEILEPANNSWFSIEPFNLSFQAWDNKADIMTYAVYDGEFELANGSTANGTITAITINTTALGDCNHILLVNVTDYSGETGSDTVTIHIDLTPPTVELLSPATNGTCFDSEPVNVTFRLWDNKATVLNYSFFLDGLEVENGTLANGSGKEVALGMLSVCNHSIRINATDAMGLVVSVEITIYVDLTPPTVELLSPDEGVIYRKACVGLNFIAEDPGVCPCGIDEMYYVLDGEDPVVMAGNTTIGNLDPCDHTLLLYVADRGGKQNSTLVNFTAYPGDISGDGVVNIFDLQRLAWAFLSKPGDDNWTESADLNCDNTVNIFDLQILAWYFMNNYNTLC